MEYTKLGTTGLDVSRICFGTSRFDRTIDGEVQTTHDEAHELLDAFADRGGNFLDTSEVYGDGWETSERWIGEWLADREREDFVLASKVAGPLDERPVNRSGLSPKHVREAIEGTLDRLGTDYLDLYYIHWWDDTVPIQKTLRVLDDLVREGTVHHLGASNLAAWQLVKSIWESDRRDLARFDVIEPHYNAASREESAELIDVCADQGIAVCPYSALEQGFLTGKYERTEDGIETPAGTRGDLRDWSGFEERQWAVLDAVRSVAAELNVTPTQVALRWLMDRQRFTCVPIVAARTIDQLDENLGAVDVDLSRAQRERITAAYDETA